MFIVPCTNYTAEVLRSHPWGETLRGPSRRRRACFLTLTAMSLPMTSPLMEYNDLVFVARLYFILYNILCFLYIYFFFFTVSAYVCARNTSRVYAPQRERRGREYEEKIKTRNER